MSPRLLAGFLVLMAAAGCGSSQQADINPTAAATQGGNSNTNPAIQDALRNGQQTGGQALGELPKGK